jgi:hypothetical protein
MKAVPPPRLLPKLLPEPEEKMNDLLDNAVAAHGSLDRWNQVKSITVDASINGALWYLKGKPDALKDVRFEVDTTRERLTMDFVGQDKRSVFEPSRVEMQGRDGALIGARDEPERSFDGHQLETPWGRHSSRVFRRGGAVDVSKYAVPVHLARVRHRRDRPHRGRR